jgi:hypothetical protein
VRWAFVIGGLLAALLLACSGSEKDGAPIEPASSSETPAAAIATMPDTFANALTVPRTTPTRLPPRPTSTTTAGTYNDPFAYCAAVGTVDAPDARYVGAAFTSEIATGLADATGMPKDSPWRSLPGVLTWRCGAGEVKACIYGNNLPCNAKVDFSTTPADRIAAYCAALHPGDEPFIPGYVDNKASAYEWRCVDGVAVIAQTRYTADAQGFISRYWYELSP